MRSKFTAIDEHPVPPVRENFAGKIILFLDQTTVERMERYRDRKGPLPASQRRSLTVAVQIRTHLPYA
jgi:hypothetical protein